jgi:hypothetical protein
MQNRMSTSLEAIVRSNSLESNLYRLSQVGSEAEQDATLELDFALPSLSPSGTQRFKHIGESHENI